MAGLKRFNKPHLTILNGLWGVLWPELTPQNLDGLMETWGWIMRMNAAPEEKQDV